MTILPLDQIRPVVRGHVSALRWIGLLYCLPTKFSEMGGSLPRWQRAMIALRLALQVIPYLVLASGLVLWPWLGGLWTEARLIPSLFTLSVVLVGIVDLGLAFGFAAALGLGFVFRWGGGICIGFVVGFSLVYAIAYHSEYFMWIIAPGFFAGCFAGALGGCAVRKFSLIFAVSIEFYVAFGLGLASSIWVPYEFLPAHRVGYVTVLTPLYGMPIGLALWFGYLIVALRLYYFPFHFFGLDRLLVRYVEDDPEAGNREIDRLIDGYPAQREAALRARAILVARRAAAAMDLARLDEILASLPVGNKSFLKETPDLRRRVHEITALQARLDTLGRPFLQEPFAALLVKEIEVFEQQVAGFKPPLSTEFRKASRLWLEVARRQLDAARAAATREPTSQVFRAGDPVNREREAFVPRDMLLGELEQQVMLATGCPGLLIYGRRRMGKSTLLRNLSGLLPPRVLVVSLSMQEARAFTSLPDLIALISQRVAAVMPEAAELPTDLKGFEHFLDATQKRLDAEDRRLLLAIDEYENLDYKIGEGTLSEDFLAVIRESVQTHRRLIWAFAGSHGIDELVHARWSSYLVSARTIEVTPFEPAETRLLLTEPLKHSSLWKASKSEPPRFEPGFWGGAGIERIHAEAGGWPHLVQLIAETVVDLVNDAGGASVDGLLLERALDRAVVRGNNVFLELLERESRLPGEWDYLRGFRRVEEQPVPEDEALDRSLRRRRLVIEEGGHYRLRVPLMGRWLRQRV